MKLKFYPKSSYEVKILSQNCPLNSNYILNINKKCKCYLKFRGGGALTMPLANRASTSALGAVGGGAGNKKN
jgi:hypothetical protein